MKISTTRIILMSQARNGYTNKCKMAEEQEKTVIQTVEGLTSLTARINELCARPRITDCLSIQSMLKSSALLAEAAKPKVSVMDTILKGDALSAALAAPSKWTLNPLDGVAPAMPAISKELLLGTNLTALATMEAQTGALARSKGIAQLTSVASQITSISEALASQPNFIKEMIAPSSMLTDLQRIAEKTHKTIIEAGNLTAWQLGVLDSASFMVDRHIDWASRFCSTAYDIEPIPQIVELDDYSPKLNVIELLPEELEYEKSRNEDITPGEALEKTPSYQMSERGKGLVERIVNINETCLRKNREPIFKCTDTTMMAAATLSGTVCNSKSSFGDLVDGLYFIFYENLEYIKAIVTDPTVRKEDIYQCIFRVKHIRTDYRHDNDHGKESKIKQKIKDIGESYAYYTGKVAPTLKSDFLTAQEGLYDDFDRLTDHLQEIIENLA